MLFESKEVGNRIEAQSFEDEIAQHFSSFTLHNDEVPARAHFEAMSKHTGFENYTDSPGPSRAHRVAPIDENSAHPAMAMHQHPHMSYFPIYPHMMASGASDVRYIAPDTGTCAQINGLFETKFS